MVRRRYQKIIAACRQASLDGYRYIWIDTCCIEQEDEKDLKENIPKMYGFYQNSAVCYVYLSDVSSKRDFRNSQWFKRGWTLQELVAPRTVWFFDSHWQYLGDKDELKDDIFRKTTIPPDILSGKQSIRDIPIIDRMTWAMERKTTKKQDLAYCLQGLLDVRVEPVYTEFWLTSFNKLGRALLDKYPDLEGKLGISRAQLSDPDSDYSFRDHAWERLGNIRDEMLKQRLYTKLHKTKGTLPVNTRRAFTDTNPASIPLHPENMCHPSPSQRAESLSTYKRTGFIAINVALISMPTD
ncbi:hypothetical protein K435DRAFT_962935 [Dendrothele bispora CBS 962.96]|uniref:Heterokaryon incompatibility domain-containing protein n=1 Tax=Dendrothele bispora (strain CBS 962.96) TaxID=1314807 RepID=A0A4S8MIR5_DENBC|nr:hypothetical protein K435DRAFT_962935 [Dendrothele bispora CBS 962.96]